MSPERLQIMAIEPWLRGSHLRFLDTWGAHSAHAVEVIGLPGRHWKWRMEGSAYTLARRCAQADQGPPDVLFATDYVDLPRLLGFLPPSWAGTPTVFYLHENQLTYPQQADAREESRDNHYGFTNILSCLAASRVVFNSHYHAQEFTHASHALLEALPPPAPRREVSLALEQADVVYPGVDLDDIRPGPGAPVGSPLRVVYNHRWEHDKDPAGFLRAILEARRSAPVQVVMLGEVFESTPDGLGDLQRELGRDLLHAGYARDGQEYVRLLGGCDVAVSTARHEFYGIALLEAVAAGCTPLAPDDLSYPEVLGPLAAERALFTDHSQLVRRLVAAAREPERLRVPAARAAVRAAVGIHDARATARALDTLCEEVAERGAEIPGKAP